MIVLAAFFIKSTLSILNTNARYTLFCLPVLCMLIARGAGRNVRFARGANFTGKPTNKKIYHPLEDQTQGISKAGARRPPPPITSGGDMFLSPSPRYAPGCL